MRTFRCGVPVPLFMFAFSTCWNSSSHSNGESMLDEIRFLGFSNIELSHGIPIQLVEGIERALAADPQLKITSLHNFCPLPIGFLHAAPNVYQFSSPDERERLRAIRWTLNTLDFATRVRARFVVLHIGSAPTKNYTSALKELIYAGGRESPAYQKLLQEAVSKRQKHGRKAFSQTMKSLEALVPAAEERNIILAIENRSRLEEIPTQSELDEIFATFNSSHLAYWHDSGHAQIWHNLGLCNHLEWLQHFQGRLVGSHLHDVAYPDEDHQIPGDGMIAFEKLTALMQPSVLKVFEFEPGTPAEWLKEHLPSFMDAFEIVSP